ncbi:MAG TPA: hypothetical protein PKD55_16780 [Bellilinea sp.]|nr:hypothetical protein [Bellilinea sp.]
MNIDKIVMLGFPEETAGAHKGFDPHRHAFYICRPMKERPDIVAYVWGLPTEPTKTLVFAYLSIPEVGRALTTNSVLNANSIRVLKVDGALHAACLIHDAVAKHRTTYGGKNEAA